MLVTSSNYAIIDGGEAIKLPCPHCPSSDAYFIFNLEGTLWGKCHSCGSWKVDNQGEDIQVSTVKEHKDNGDKFIPFEVGDAISLGKRKISLKTCKHWGYESFDKGHIANYYDENRRKIGQKIRGHNKEFRVVGNINTLYGKWLCQAGKFIVITEGELDALSVAEVQDNKWPVVSVPTGASGAKSIIRRELEWLETNYEYVVLLFDNDEAGKKAAIECSELFSPDKCRIAKIADSTCKDASDCLQNGKIDVLTKAIWNAKVHMPDSIVRVSDVMDRLKEKPKKGLPYPFPTLTKLTRGMRLETLNLWTSGSGMGKTSVFRYIVSTLAQDETMEDNIGIIFLEETPEKTVRILAGHLAGQRFDDPDTEYKDSDLEHYAGMIEDRDNLIFNDSYKIGSADDWKHIYQRIRYMVVSLGCKYIFLDHLTFLTDGLEGSASNAATERVMKDLVGIVRGYQVCINIIAHVRKSTGNGVSSEAGGQINQDSIKGTGAIKQYCWGMFALERDQQEEDEALKNISAIRILKERDYGESVGKKVYIKYDPKTTLITEVDDPYLILDDIT